jgi:hypothetical protein
VTRAHYQFNPLQENKNTYYLFMCEKDQDFDVAEYFGVKFADG